MPDGGWLPVPIIPGALQVFSGTLLTRWTNGQLRPGRHRVVAGGTVTRRSTAVFCYPSLDTVVGPLAPFVGPEGATEEPVLVWDQVKARVEDYLEEFGRPDAGGRVAGGQAVRGSAGRDLGWTLTGRFRFGLVRSRRRTVGVTGLASRGDLGGVGQAQLAPGAFVERRPAQADDPRGAGRGRRSMRSPGVDVRLDLPVDLDGQPPAGGQDVQRQAVVHRQHEPAVEGGVRRRRGDQQRLDRGTDDRARPPRSCTRWTRSAWRRRRRRPRS